MSKLFCFIAPSGAGKSTIQHSLPLPFLTHYTTRPPREGEIDGYHIKNISRETFSEMFMSKQILTVTIYSDNLYGAPEKYIQRITRGTPYHATATKESISQFKEILGEDKVVVIYIKPPSVEILRERMTNRGDSPEDIEKRIKNIYSDNELKNELISDYVVVNNNLDEAVAQVHTIIQTELKISDLGRFEKEKEMLT